MKIWIKICDNWSNSTKPNCRNSKFMKLTPTPTTLYSHSQLHEVVPYPLPPYTPIPNFIYVHVWKKITTVKRNEKKMIGCKKKKGAHCSNDSIRKKRRKKSQLVGFMVWSIPFLLFKPKLFCKWTKTNFRLKIRSLKICGLSLWNSEWFAIQ